MLLRKRDGEKERERKEGRAEKRIDLNIPHITLKRKKAGTRVSCM